jgi:hypothetical protein
VSSRSTRPAPSPPPSPPASGGGWGGGGWLAGTIRTLVEFVDGPSGVGEPDQLYHHHSHHSRYHHHHGSPHHHRHRHRCRDGLAHEQLYERTPRGASHHASHHELLEDVLHRREQQQQQHGAAWLRSPPSVAFADWDGDEEAIRLDDEEAVPVVQGAWHSAGNTGNTLAGSKSWAPWWATTMDPRHGERHGERRGVPERYPPHRDGASAAGDTPAAKVAPRRASSVQADGRGRPRGHGHPRGSIRLYPAAWEDEEEDDVEDVVEGSKAVALEQLRPDYSRARSAVDSIDVAQEWQPVSTNDAADLSPTYSPPGSPPKRSVRGRIGRAAGGEAADVRTLAATLRAWDRPTLVGAHLPALVALSDAPKAIALSALLPSRTLTSLTLRDCQLGERCALAIGQLLASGVPLAFLDLRGNAIGERGLAAVSSGIQEGVPLAELKLVHAMPHPFSEAALDCLHAAASRCTVLISIHLGEVSTAAAGSGGSLAKLQRALLLNVEAASAASRPAMAWGHESFTCTANGDTDVHALAPSTELEPLPMPSPPPSPPNVAQQSGESADSVAAPLAAPNGGERSHPAPNGPRPTAQFAPATVPVGALSADASADKPSTLGGQADGLSSVLGALARGGLRTLKLTHDAAAARAPPARQIELLRALSNCRTLRIAQLVNVGLGDSWGFALAAALPRLRSLRILDVSYNHIGSGAARAIATALPSNHSLVWCQVLPQWLPLDRAAELALGAALAPRRIKLDLHVRAAKGVVSAGGDVGEPSVRFEWRGVVLSTGAATPAATLNPTWGKHFTLCVPGSLLWPPSRTPLTLRLIDQRRDAQHSAPDLPMATCELPLGALLLAEEVLAVHCTLNRPAGARPIAVRGAAELLLELSTLHVGAEQPDDQVLGVPAVWLHGLAQQRRAEIGAATRLQAGYRGRKLRRYIISRRQSPELVRQKLEAPRSLSAEAAEASHAESAGGTVCLALRRCPHGSWRLVRRLVRTVAPCCEACCRPALSGLRGRAYEVYHNRAPASAPGRASDGAAAAANTAMPLLPQTMERSDVPRGGGAGAKVAPADLKGNEPAARGALSSSSAGGLANDQARRREQLLRLVLCLLCSCIVVFGAAGLAILVVVLT